MGRSAPVSLIGLGYFFGFGKSTSCSSVFLWYIIDFPATFLMPLDKKVKLASFQENMLSHKTVVLSLCTSLWEDKLLYTLVPAARFFSRAACLAISHGTGVSKICSRRVSFWGEYDDFSKVVGLY